MRDRGTVPQYVLVFVAQKYHDGSQVYALLERTSKTGSSRSNDSGLGVDEAPRYADDTVLPLVDRAAVSNDTVFMAPLSSMPDARATAAATVDYIGLDDLMSSSESTSPLSPVMSLTGYITAWIDNDNRCVLPLRDVDVDVEDHSHNYTG